MYGQERILRELSFIIPEIQSGRNLNILLAGPSGHGKTSIAYGILNALGFNNSQISMPPDFPFDASKRFHFLDEIQELKNPEPLYPLMDRGTYTIILATNELGEVKEPLVNRCVPLILEPYTQYEIERIIRDTFRPIEIPDEILEHIASKCFSNPRVAKNLTMRLGYIFRSVGVPSTIEGLDEMLENILSIYKEGVNQLEKTYLEYLSTVGGRASLDLMSNGLHMTKSTLLRDVEPHLLYLNKIQITSRGRELRNHG
jgi:Holliday junction resolvasome RuvABC ATP-dependent DNA helicase subunit